MTPPTPWQRRPPRLLVAVAFAVALRYGLKLSILTYHATPMQPTDLTALCATVDTTRHLAPGNAARAARRSVRTPLEQAADRHDWAEVHRLTMEGRARRAAR